MSARCDGADGIVAVDIVVLVLVAVAGVVMRVWVLRSELGALDSDEAIVGLMARRFALDGRPSFFYWGQSYGGTIEPMLTGVVFRIFGPSIAALKAVSLLLCCTATGLVAALGKRLFGLRRGLYAAAAFWICTGNYIWLSTKARAFYWAALNLGLVMLWATVAVSRRPGNRRAWVVLGVAAGLGWWTSPQILFFMVPVALWLVVKLRLRVVRPSIVWALPPAILGASPWIVSNVRTHLASLRYEHEVPGTYGERLRLFFTHGMPTMFGLEASGYLFARAALVGAYVVMLALLAWAVLRRRRQLSVVFAFVVIYPFVFASFPTSYAIGEGRYLLYLLGPCLVAVVAHLRRRSLTWLALVIVLAIAVADLNRIETRSRPFAVDTIAPVSDRELLTAIDQEHVRFAWANYWVAYRVTFETDQRVIVSPDIADQIRHVPFADQVQASGQAARIVITTSGSAATLASRFPAVEGCVRRRAAGPYVIYLRDASRQSGVAPNGTPCVEAAARFLQV